MAWPAQAGAQESSLNRKEMLLSPLTWISRTPPPSSRVLKEIPKNRRRQVGTHLKNVGANERLGIGSGVGLVVRTLEKSVQLCGQPQRAEPPQLPGIGKVPGKK